MPFPEDLLEQARHLATRERNKPRQASLRRAVSTAYYALFHLLISEATLNWKRPEQRSSLARMFQHGVMKSACARQRDECNRILKANPAPADSAERSIPRHLRDVTEKFCIAHELRQSADYDNATKWTRSDSLDLVHKVEDAFRSWKAIRNEPAAHAFLITLLGRPQGH